MNMATRPSRRPEGHRRRPVVRLLLLTVWLIPQCPVVWGDLPHHASAATGPTSAAPEPLADTPDTDDVTDDVDDILKLADQPLESLTTQKVVVPLLDVEVTTVSRTESTVGQSPAAVYVVSNEMIRRSGARNIPEALRLVPGVNVARVSSDRWAISIRGFTDVFSNKLLVQIDGRAVYTPVFSGVFWDQQEVLLEDVDRIEVIRGPGATVWGANAVNGIVNIITKSASETQGVFLQGGGGTEQRGFGAFRYGGRTGDSFHYRIYGKALERDDGFHPTGANDDWRSGQIGFRMDWEPCPCTAVTLQGDHYEGTSGRRHDGAISAVPFWEVGASTDERPSGSNILMRVSREVAEDTDWAVQLYYDRATRPTPDTGFDLTCDTFDLDFQHRFPPAHHHSLIWGFGYRNTRNVSGGSFLISINPPIRSFGTISYFVQDQIELREDLLYLTLGSKFEHNDFSGFEFQPTARLLWTPTQRQTAWASVSRAVRTPSRADQDFRVVSAPVDVSFAPPGVTFMRIEGSSAVRSEELLAFEIGYRAQPTDRFWWDVAVFYNDYENLTARVPATPFPPPAAFPPVYWSLVYDNAMRGETYGWELAAAYQVNPCWNVQIGYSFLDMQLHARPDTTSTAESAEGESPQNQVYLQSGWEFGHGVELDLIWRHVDTLPGLGIPSYIAMDVRLAWFPSETLEMAVVGRNLLDSSHPEYDTRSFYASEVESEVYGMATLRY